MPLGEEFEAYEIDVLDGTVVKRTLTSPTPNITYSETDQIADWGSAQASYAIAIYQMSGTIGRGAAGRAVI